MVGRLRVLGETSTSRATVNWNPIFIGTHGNSIVKSILLFKGKISCVRWQVIQAITFIFSKSQKEKMNAYYNLEDNI